jgi:hypothetical protein
MYERIAPDSVTYLQHKGWKAAAEDDSCVRNSQRYSIQASKRANFGNNPGAVWPKAKRSRPTQAADRAQQAHVVAPY